MNRNYHWLPVLLLLGGLLAGPDAAAQPGVPGSMPGTIGRTGSGVSSEIEQILGESENDIMQGIKDEVENLLGGMLSSVLGVSPSNEVATLRKLMKDAYGKQQKIEMQQYKVDFEDMKAHTDLSPAFVQYYDDLNLAKYFDQLTALGRSAGQAIDSRAFSAAERSMLTNSLEKLTQTDDLASEVKTACNLNREAVWMSEAERVKILETVRRDIVQRLAVANKFRAVVGNVLAFRTKTLNRNGYAQSLYKTDTKINRYVGTTRTRF